MRELREFREAHAGFVEAGIPIAGISTDSLESHRRWTARLSIPFPLLSDPERVSARELGFVRKIGIAGWTVELMRRATILAGRDGRIAAVWGEVKIRGHAREVLAAARALVNAPLEGDG